MKAQRRVIGQCNIADFRHLEHLSDIMARGEEVDLTNLTNRQKMAVRVLHHFNQCNVSFEVLLKIKEVLIWDMGDGGAAFEYKLLHPGDSETLKILREMSE